jgi:hypothetical protein
MGLFMTLFWFTMAQVSQKRVLMPAKKSRPSAVLMGDVVASERAQSLKAVHRAFNDAVNFANAHYAADIESPLTITLGDEFQGLTRRLAHAWRIATTLRLKLLAANVSCRFVIGMAQLDTPINPRRAWNMMGRGLAETRDKLNDKRSSNAYRFSLRGETLIELLLDAVGDSLTEVERGWTATQLKYYSSARDASRTNAELAKRLGVTPRSLYKVLHAARGDFHRRQSGAIERALTELDERHGLT